ncbi:MAG: hypothetical protein ACREXS_13945 [Gammaproteobacteria bacterium]
MGYRKHARGGVWLVRVYKDGKYSKCNIGRAGETGAEGLLGQRCVYRHCALEEWVENKLRRSTSDERGDSR